MNHSSPVPLLIVGAGPYGLAIATYARHRGIGAVNAGRPMELWRHHMPAGMFLRSPVEWDFDPVGTLTFVTYLRERGIAPEGVDPIPLDLFLGYVAWFLERADLDIRDRYVTTLDLHGSGFRAVLDDGETIEADRVVATPGLRYFAQVPDALVRGLPRSRYSHASELVDFDRLAGQRVVIVGGRQSAFEWAALMRDRGVREITLVYRHDTPQFTVSDWSPADALIRASFDERGWFRRLPLGEQARINRAFWEEGRLKLEPWLQSRIQDVRLHPRNAIAETHVTEAGDLDVRLEDGTRIVADHLVLATGYKPDVARVPYLSRAIRDRLATRDGVPALDEDFMSSVPGLFFAGLIAAREFGPFVGFMRACSLAAHLIVDRVASTYQTQ